MKRCAGWAAIAMAALGGVPASAITPPDRRLDFEVIEGLNLNRLTRQGNVASHLVLRSGSQPRILIAFPAGNSGVGLWFAKQSAPLSWTLLGAPRIVHEKDGRGRALRGIEVKLITKAPSLEPRQAVLSSVRVLRDYASLGSLPADLAAAPVVTSQALTWARDRLDGAPGYRLCLEVTHGELKEGRISAGSEKSSAKALKVRTGI